MKKYFFILLFLQFGLFFSQYKPKDYHLESKIVLKNSNDTIKARILALWAFKKDHFAPQTFMRKLTIFNSEGIKSKINESDVKYLEIKDFDGKIRKFINSFEILNKEIGLLEILYSGKMSYYCGFQTVNLYGNVNSTEYLIEKNKSLIDTNLFSGSNKKLKERLSNYPDLIELLDKVSDKKDLIKILELYNSK